MVIKEKRGQDILYSCEKCEFSYPNKERALECEKHCTENMGCNLEIVKYAVNFSKG